MKHLIAALLMMSSASVALAAEKTMKAPPAPKPAAAPPDTLETAVRFCVDLVHTMRVEEFEKMFYKSFDAYYNPADGAVQNNAFRNGDRMPLYAFNKCMVQNGFPLSYGTSQKTAE
jgi:hypothetical protein